MMKNACAHLPRVATCLPALLACLLPASLAMADEVLVSFADASALNQVRQTGVQATVADGALHVVAGHDRRWPGVTVTPAGKPWDLSAFEAVTVKVTNRSATPALVGLRIDNPGATGKNHSVQAGEEALPGQTATLRARLRHTLIGSDGKPIKLFGMRDYPGGATGEQREFDPSKVTEILVFIADPTEDHTIDISDIRAVGSYRPPNLSSKSFFPFIDKFGQYMHADWPGKTHSVEQMKAALVTERKALAAHPKPAGWDKYGGWQAGPALQATGFFRTAKHGGKWWLVDPAGKLFLSIGVISVRAWGDDTPIADRGNWFAWLPEKGGPLAKFLRPRKCLLGHYAGQRPMTYDFSAANMARKYGIGEVAAMRDMILRRLASWGINTLGNWSDPAIYLERRMPYVVPITSGGRKIEGSEGYWGKFPDPFDPGFASSMREAMAAQAKTTAGDPWCIGYFVDNELAWGSDTVSLAVAVLRSPADQPAKRAFVEDLKARYGAIDALNRAWGARYASWTELLASQSPPGVAKARGDLEAFQAKLSQMYFRTVRDAIKAVAPHQLYLGCRFAWVNRLAVDAAAKYCDVVSYNKFQRSVAGFRVPGGHDVPAIISAFSFGAIDRGLFGPGVVGVADQKARGEAYEAYVRSVLDDPQLVGCHWFEYRDEPTTGRTWDGEDYQAGLVDVCDTPYVETVRAIRRVTSDMYEYRANHTAATAASPAK